MTHRYIALLLFLFSIEGFVESLVRTEENAMIGDSNINCKKHKHCYKTREPLTLYQAARKGNVQYGNTGCQCAETVCRITARLDGAQQSTDCVFCGTRCGDTEEFYETLSQMRGVARDAPLTTYEPLEPVGPVPTVVPVTSPSPSKAKPSLIYKHDNEQPRIQLNKPNTIGFDALYAFRK